MELGLKECVYGGGDPGMGLGEFGSNLVLHSSCKTSGEQESGYGVSHADPVTARGEEEVTSQSSFLSGQAVSGQAVSGRGGWGDWRQQEGNPNLARWGKHTPGYIHSPVIVKARALLTQVDGVFFSLPLLTSCLSLHEQRAGAIKPNTPPAAEWLGLDRAFVFDCSLEEGDPISPLG